MGLLRIANSELRTIGELPNQELLGAKSELRWAYVHLIREAANLPIIYQRPIFGLHHKACKYVFLRILKSEAPTNRKYEDKRHIEASKTFFIEILSIAKTVITFGI